MVRYNFQATSRVIKKVFAMRYALLLLLAMFPLHSGETLAQAVRDKPKDAPKPSGSVAQTPVPTSPERTTASFGDWVLRCENAAVTAKRVCELGQAMTVQGQASPIAQIAIGRISRDEPMRVTLVLPVAVTLLTKPKILSETDDKSPLELVWQRCIPGGCIASLPIPDAAVARFAARSEPGSIVFKDAAERDATLPLSFRGLPQALAALAKEP